MIQQELIGLLEEALASLRAEKILPEDAEVVPEIERPARREHGDFSTNVALELSGRVTIPPRQLAERVLERLPDSERIARTEIAGPGFINFFLSHGWLYETLEAIAKEKEEFGRSNTGEGIGLQVEFGSANPTGPIHVGNARGIIIGDALAGLLSHSGHAVERENYINDAGGQIDRFARSLEARYYQALGRNVEMPEEGYEGEYLVELGQQLAASEGMGLVGKLAEIRVWGLERMIESQKQTLERFGVVYDQWTSETSLHDSGKIEKAIERLRRASHIYEADGAVWFRATEFGHSQDRVMVRSAEKGGLPTYLAADTAYLLDKLDRGFEHLIYVWGPDHHGTAENLLAVARALEIDHRVEILIYQSVNFLEGGKPARMSKRTGDIITLDELLDEVGVDAARYTFLTRSHDAAMDFDFEQVKRQSLDNPVYYVQYVHTRCCGIHRYAGEQGINLAPIEEVELTELSHESERELIRKLSEFPEAVEVAGRLRAPYRLTNYVYSVAEQFNQFYRDCQVIGPEPNVTQARLWLVEATRQVIANTLDVLGVGAPERM